MKVNVKIHVDKKDGNSAWIQFADAAGKPEYETASAEFKTGAAPDYIDPNNVKYTYPIEKQYNLLAKEYDRGYIILDKGQAYLFRAGDEAGSWTYAASFASGATTEETSVSYDEAAKTVNFGLPGNLKTASVHRLQIMRRPAKSTKIDENLQTGSTKVESSGTAVETEITENKLSGVLALSSEKSLYTINFRTSKYPTFAAKMAAASASNLFVPVGNEYILGLRLTSDEKLDAAEKDILIKGQADGTEKWYTQFLNPVIYDHYGAGDASIKIGWRDVNKYGVKPLKAISLFNRSEEYLSLTEAQITSGNAPNAGDNITVQYEVPFYTVNDYVELINKAANKYQNLATVPANAKALLSSSGYLGIFDDSYGLKLKYILPGINKETSSFGYRITF